ncbi:class I SAM-dependent methyltransferase [Candidatus Thorarchaeota archaeon]|nr:MAG: class I SAM-dependent methyltransferase [Candidatus Thorarchaeota archaeon]
MNVMQLIKRVETPEPWSEGEKIPWNDPGFSERMLEHHLTQEHDLASRKFEIIDRHVDWIHNKLEGKPSRILDLACGPGLYSSRLTRLGHSCRGIDFGPASIRYAREQALKEGLEVDYVLEDIRTADYEDEYDLVLFIYGEFNVFKPADIRRVLRKAYDSLREGGVFIAEPNRYETVKREGTAPAVWYSSQGGLFSPKPHLCLMENFWDQERDVATTRYFIVDAETSNVTLHASSMVAYTRENLEQILRGVGFKDIVFHESLSGGEKDLDENLEVIEARK